MISKPLIGVGLLTLVAIAMGAGGSKPDDSKPEPDPKKPEPDDSKPEPDPKKPEPDPKKPDPDPKKPVDLVVDAAAEAAACEYSLTFQPATYDGLSRGVNQPLSTWLGIVAWRRAYPASPKQPDTVAELAAFSRLTSCVTAGLNNKPAPDPNKPAPDPNKPAPDPNKPAPGNASPPKGAILTPEEAKAASNVLGVAKLGLLPDTIDAGTVPPPDNVRKAWDTDLTWRTKYALYATYRQPGTTWVDAHGQGPLKVPANTTWVDAYNRLLAFFTANPVQAAPPPNANAAPPKGATMTADEVKYANDVLSIAKLGVLPDTIDAGTVPPPDNVRKAWDTDLTWRTKYALYATYRQPGTPWVEAHGQGPVKVPANTTWVDAYNRLLAFFTANPLQAAPPPNANANAAPPKGATMTADEVKYANDVLGVAKLGLLPDTIDAGTVPPPDNVRKAWDTDLTWRTKYALYATYRQPGAPWVEAHGQGPVKVPANTTWVDAYNRFLAFFTANPA
jgi:hypothetical protein